MSHDDGDWDSEVAEGIFEWLIWNDDGLNWYTLVLFLMGLTLMAYHYWG